MAKVDAEKFSEISQRDPRLILLSRTLFIILCSSSISYASAISARDLLVAAANAHGGRAHFYSLRDAQMEVTTCGEKNDCTTFIQRYHFADEQLEGMNAKRYYFLFAFPFKLLDKGMVPVRGPRRVIDGDEYETVDVRYPQGDRFVIYINHKTKQIDRFLFTDLSQKRNTPHLMVIHPREVSGVLVFAEREEYEANWNGEIVGSRIRLERLNNIQFWNGFSAADIKAVVKTMREELPPPDSP